MHASVDAGGKSSKDRTPTIIQKKRNTRRAISCPVHTSFFSLISNSLLTLISLFHSGERDNSINKNQNGSATMMLTRVDSHGLDVVLKPLADKRVVDTYEKLQKGSYELKQAPIRPLDHFSPFTCCQIVLLHALIFGPALVNTAVFTISEDQ